MSGSDSISNPVARRISYTGSYPRLAARLLLAQLNSARGWWVPLCWRVSWLVTDMTCWLCMMTSWLHHDDVILIRVSLWVGSSGIQVESAIRAKKTRGSHVARWCAWAASSPARVGACGHARRPISTPFSPVASSLPPLHSGMVKT